MAVDSRIVFLAAALSVSAAWAQTDPCGQWEVIPSPNPDNAIQTILRDVAVVGPNDAWAVGGYLATVNGTTVSYATSMHWDGGGWTIVPTPSPTACPECTWVELWAVDATGPNDVWAAGGKRVQAPDGFVGTHVLVMHWDGSAWTVLDTPIQTGASGDLVYGVEAIAPDDVWFFGEGFYIGPTTPDPALAMHWNGSSFQLTTVPSVNPQTSGFGDGNSLHDASALASNDIWAVGAASDGDSMPSAHSQIQHWNGSNWTPVPAGAMPGYWHDLNAVAAIAPNDVWAAGETFDGSYQGLAIHWDGNSWSQVSIPGSVSDLHAFASDNVYAVGSGVMHWDGASWTSVETFPGVDSPSLTGVGAADPCDLWTAGRQWSGTLTTFTAHLVSDRQGDVDGDGDVDIADLALLLSAFGAYAGDPTFNPAADLDASGCVDLSDLAVLLSNFGA